MRSVVISAGRRALAAFVFLAAGWLVVWLAAFRVGRPMVIGDVTTTDVLAETRCAVGSQYCISVRPAWTIPAAVAIACLGVATAALISRGRRNWPLRPGSDDV